MNTKKWLAATMISSLVAAVAFTVGCESNSKPTPNGSGSAASLPPKEPAEAAGAPAATSTDNKADSEHGHKDGQHGGTIVSLGRDSYHVEAVVAADGQIRLFTLGKDETRVIDVESQVLKGYVKAQSDTEAQEVSFEPTPQDGDTVDRTSVFVGKLPAALMGRSLEVTIPNIRIDGERFRLGFQTTQAEHAESTSMPEKVGSAAEKELYLTPGGHYTTADIQANGNLTASQKFKGIKSDHNMNPKPGDTVCPISGTKANPKFTWIIGGKPYQFCCPPCVDEFLTNAKTSRDPLPDLDSFIKN